MELNMETERKRSQYSKRPKGDEVKETQLSPSHHLTRQQEISIMVSALKQVISGVGVGAGDNNNIINDQRGMVLSLPDSDTCRLCRIDGCLGCNLFSLSKAKTKVDKNLITTKKRNNIGVVDFFPYPNNPPNQNSQQQQQQQQQLERNNKKQRQETVLMVPETSSREDQKPFLNVDDEIQSWISMDYVGPFSSTPSASS